MKRVYLAGPDVFRADVETFFIEKKADLRHRGFEGLSPFDAEIELEGEPCKAHGHTIYRANVELIRSCDAVLANLSPFRGPSADVGTVFEIGYALALGKPVVGYSNDNSLYEDRVQPDTYWSIEPFGLRDNLMIEGGLLHQPSPTRLCDSYIEAAQVLQQLFPGSRS